MAGVNCASCVSVRTNHGSVIPFSSIIYDYLRPVCGSWFKCWYRAEWHEVKLQYTAVSKLYVPLSIVGVAANKLGPPCDDAEVQSISIALPEGYPGDESL